ncbi:MAG: type IV conjugative transfer system protein TraL [Candidatus Methanosuratincola sp.]
MTEIQRYLDEPPTLFFWEIDEVIVMAASIFMGIMVGALLSFGIAGVLCAQILRKIKKKSSEGVFVHFLYWHGFFNLKGCPKSYMREFVE